MRFREINAGSGISTKILGEMVLIHTKSGRIPKALFMNCDGYSNNEHVNPKITANKKNGVEKLESGHLGRRSEHWQHNY